MTEEGKAFPYVYYWHYQGRKGQLCRVLVRAKRKDSILVEFEDGYRMVSLRNSVRRIKVGEEG
jgi:hypothetical protein